MISILMLQDLLDELIYVCAMCQCVIYRFIPVQNYEIRNYYSRWLCRLGG
jgi:hypothetical protein